ncbi:MAG: hypothetical protein SH809_01685 [Rhodothermales bacterium]|nr:hypothetical protein [Rhodothermales bacterium]
MKLMQLVLALVVTFQTSPAGAQSPVRESELVGEWRLVFDLKNEAETAAERVILNAVDGLLDEIDVHFTFKAGGDVKIVSRAFDDPDKDIEYSTWQINDEGQLLLGENEHVEMDDDTVWMREGNRLVALEMEDGAYRVKDGIYMERQRN